VSLADVADVTNVVLGMLTAGLFLALLRLLHGPTLPDRVVALELVSLLTAGIIVTYAVAREQPVFLDVAIVLAIIAFLATVAFARYLERSVP
jgi:multicomponent Na+:H+ antiporter subunit F